MTAPGISPSRLESSSSEANLSGRVWRAAEFLQIDAPVAAHGEEKEMLPSVVPEEEVLCLGFGVRKGKLRRLGHVADRRMIDALELDSHIAQKLAGLLFVHHIKSTTPGSARPA